MHLRRRLWLTLVVTICTALPTGCHPRPQSTRPPRTSELQIWWHNYRERFITADGRVIRPRQGNDTVSEGQAYAMLGAVLLDDRETFARLFAWTVANLSRENGGHADALLAWHWAAGVVTDWMPASDADCDFAFALSLAALRWDDAAYRDHAKRVAQCIMTQEIVRTTQGKLILLPGLWGETADGTYVQNPSYYNPAAYRLFYQLTSDPRWLDLADTSYWIWMDAADQRPPGRRTGLPRDWCLLTPDERLIDAPERSSQYGWEAVRIPMRIYTDYSLHGDRRGLPVATALRKILEHGKKPPKAVYLRDGTPAVSYSSLPAVSMALLAQRMSNADTQRLETIFRAYLISAEHRDDYYGQSLAMWPLLARTSVLEDLLATDHRYGEDKPLLDPIRPN